MLPSQLKVLFADRALGLDGGRRQPCVAPPAASVMSAADASRPAVVITSTRLAKDNCFRRRCG